MVREKRILVILVVVIYVALRNIPCNCFITARVARIQVYFFDVGCQKARGSFGFEVQTTTRAQSTKSFILAFTWKQFVPIRGKTFRKT